jgi:hypothetical protein
VGNAPIFQSTPSVGSVAIFLLRLELLLPSIGTEKSNTFYQEKEEEKIKTDFVWFKSEGKILDVKSRKLEDGSCQH